MRTRHENDVRDQQIVTGAILAQLREHLAAATNAVEFFKRRSSGDLERRTAAAWQKIVESVEGGLLNTPEPERPMSIRTAHAEEIATYVRGVVQEAHRSERAHVLIYSRTPYASALETIATERAAALELLRDAIDNGLLTRLAAEQRDDATDPATEAFVDVADAEHYAQRDEYVNSPDAVESDDRPTLAEQLRAVGAEQAALDAEADAFAAERREAEHFDAAEAAAVLRIEHDMAIEAGDEHDPGTCVYCGGAS
jgi:hypothetical protein